MNELRLHQLNDVKLVGRLTRDPDLRFTAKGQAVCRFDLAINRRFKDVSGEWKDDTSFIPIVTWRETAQRCHERLKKGSPIYVEGHLKSRNWETKDGQKRTTLEVVAQRIQFLAKVEGDSSAAPSAATEGESDFEASPPPASKGEESTEEEEIPF